MYIHNVCIHVHVPTINIYMYISDTPLQFNSSPISIIMIIPAIFFNTDSPASVFPPSPIAHAQVGHEIQSMSNRTICDAQYVS